MSRSRFAQFRLVHLRRQTLAMGSGSGKFARHVVVFVGTVAGLGACNHILGLEPPKRSWGNRADSDSSLAVDASAGDTRSNTSSANASTGSSAAEAGAPSVCPASECDAGTSVCARGALQTCERDELGCWVWSASETCPTDACASDFACLERAGDVDAAAPPGPNPCVGPACGVDAAAPPEPNPCVGPACGVGIGEACETDDQCAAGKCRDVGGGASVCSTANCDAPCLDYAPSGRDCVEVADDSECGEVQCPASTPCRKYTASVVTAGRCTKGECGSPKDLCAFTARNEALACDDDSLCDDAGNCDVPKFSQGAPCETSEQCTTEQCVDGVCCEQDCDALGVCMDCRPGTGKCDLVPEDDDRCEDVACDPTWTACVTESQDITSAHCARAGACKTRQDCPFEYAPKGTPCYLSDRLCDGEGDCTEPEVSCGGTTCGGFGELGCCFSSDNPELTDVTPVCSTQSECFAASNGWLVGCDEHSDCDITADQVCCAMAFNVSGHTKCTPRTECNYRAGPPATSFLELCESPAMGARVCSNGAACSVTVEDNRLPGFQFCRLLLTP